MGGKESFLAEVVAPIFKPAAQTGLKAPAQTDLPTTLDSEKNKHGLLLCSPQGEPSQLALGSCHQKRRGKPGGRFAKPRSSKSS